MHVGAALWRLYQPAKQQCYDQDATRRRQDIDAAPLIRVHGRHRRGRPVVFVGPAVTG
jgi:hypothetical protein